MKEYHCGCTTNEKNYKLQITFDNFELDIAKYR